MTELEFKKMSANIGNWLLSDNTGLSSKLMAAIALGADIPKYSNHPLDAGDFNRCKILLDYAPEVRYRFDDIAACSDKWALIIENWDRFVKTLVNSPKDFSDTFDEILDPDKFKENQELMKKRRQQVAERQARFKQEIESPKTNKNGVLKLPSSNNELVRKICANKAAIVITHHLLNDVHINENDVDSIVKDLTDELATNPYQNGFDLFRNLNFMVSSDPSVLFDVLDMASDEFSTQYKRFLIEWSEKHEISPSFDVGTIIEFKHGSNIVQGEIQSEASYLPFHYQVKVEGMDGCPLISWDDDSIELIEMPFSSPDNEMR